MASMSDDTSEGIAVKRALAFSLITLGVLSGAAAIIVLFR
jgi:hypothetical protein